MMMRLNLYGQHLGDILMAMPAVHGYLDEYPERSVTIHADERYREYMAHIHGRIEFEPCAGGITPDFRGIHRSDAWIHAIGSPPKRPRYFDGPDTSDPFWCLGGGQWIILSPEVRHSSKKWSISNWIKVAEYATYSGMTVALVGGADSVQDCSDIKAAIPGRKIIDFSGWDSPAEWMKLLASCAAVVCPDTGTAHMADFLGTKVIGLYGVSKLDEVGPYWDRRYCIEQPGMDKITPSMVIDQIKRIYG